MKEQLPIVPQQDEPGGQPLADMRMEAFCQAYTGEHRRNLVASYYAAGYTPANTRRAFKAASELLMMSAVRDRIGWIDDTGLALDRLHARDAVRRLAAIATANITDFLDDEGKVSMELIRSHPKREAIRELTREENRGGIKYTIKLKDDMKAIEMLGLAASAPGTQPGSHTVLIIET